MYIYIFYSTEVAGVVSHSDYCFDFCFTHCPFLHTLPLPSHTASSFTHLCDFCGTVFTPCLLLRLLLHTSAWLFLQRLLHTLTFASRIYIYVYIYVYMYIYIYIHMYIPLPHALTLASPVTSHTHSCFTLCSTHSLFFHYVLRPLLSLFAPASSFTMCSDSC